MCHANTDTDTANHAHGPANTPRGDAEIGTLPNSANYTYAGSTNSDTTGFGYTLGTCGNMGIGCHDTAVWGAAGGCNFCHGSVDNGYWPDGVGGDTAGEHQAHITALMDKLNVTDQWTGGDLSDETIASLKTDNANGTADAKQQRLCEYCHDDSNGVGGVGHNDGGAAEVGTFDPIWDTANPPNTADTGVAAAYTTTCAGIDCHADTTTADTWTGAGTATCSYCHGDGPATNAHGGAHHGSAE